MEVLVVFWLVCGLVAGMIAGHKGGNGLAGFIVGLLLGPLGIVISLFMGSEADKTAKLVSSGEKKICPRCAEAVQPAALVCRFCGHEFAQTEAGRNQVEQASTEAMPGRPDPDNVVTVVVVFIVLAVLALVMANGMP